MLRIGEVNTMTISALCSAISTTINTIEFNKNKSMIIKLYSIVEIERAITYLSDLVSWRPEDNRERCNFLRAIASTKMFVNVNRQLVIKKEVMRPIYAHVEGDCTRCEHIPSLGVISITCTIAMAAGSNQWK